jgi:hypothetical protein
MLHLFLWTVFVSGTTRLKIPWDFDTSLDLSLIISSFFSILQRSQSQRCPYCWKLWIQNGLFDLTSLQSCKCIWESSYKHSVLSHVEKQHAGIHQSLWLQMLLYIILLGSRHAVPISVKVQTWTCPGKRQGSVKIWSFSFFLIFFWLAQPSVWYVFLCFL